MTSKPSTPVTSRPTTTARPFSSKPTTPSPVVVPVPAGPSPSGTLAPASKGTPFPTNPGDGYYYTKTGKTQGSIGTSGAFSGGEVTVGTAMSFPVVEEVSNDIGSGRGLGSKTSKSYNYSKAGYYYSSKAGYYYSSKAGYYYSKGGKGSRDLMSKASKGSGDETFQPTFIPTFSPTLGPTLQPSSEPTTEPTLFPTLEPTLQPSPLDYYYSSKAGYYYSKGGKGSRDLMSKASEVSSDSATFFPTFSPTLAPTLQSSPEPTTEPTVELKSKCGKTAKSNGGSKSGKSKGGKVTGGSSKSQKTKKSR